MNLFLKPFSSTKFKSVLSFRNVSRSQSTFVSFLKEWRRSPVPKVMPKFEKDLMKPLDYYLQEPAPMTTELLKALNYWLDVPKDKLFEVDSILKVFQENIIMFDDFLDNSPTRRAKPSAHSIHGVESTAICALFNYGRLQKEIFQRSNYDRKIIDTWTNCLINGYRAEGYEKNWTENNYCPTEAEFFSNMIMKTSCFGDIILQLIQAESSVKLNFKPFMDALTAYSQLRDDYESLFMPEEYFDQRETFAEDLTVGKFTWPVIHAVRVKGNKEILDILRMKTSDIDIKRRAVSILKDIGTMDHCKEVLEQCDEEVEREMFLLGPNPIMDEFLYAMKDWEDPETRSNINYMF